MILIFLLYDVVVCFVFISFEIMLDIFLNIIFLFIVCIGGSGVLDNWVVVK